MAVTVDPITLDLKLQRLEFETGLDVRAIIKERDELLDKNEGWSCEVNRIEGELQDAIAEGEGYRVALDKIANTIAARPPFDWARHVAVEALRPI
jgi:hypothetical protein